MRRMKQNRKKRGKWLEIAISWVLVIYIIDIFVLRSSILNYLIKTVEIIKFKIM